MIEASKKTIIFLLIALIILWGLWGFWKISKKWNAKSDSVEIAITNETNIELDSSVASVYVTPSKDNTLRVKSTKAGELKVENDGTTIEISQKTKIKSGEGVLTLEIPGKIKTSSVKTSVGSIDISSLNMYKIELKVATGDITASNIKAYELDAEASVGTIDLSDIVATDIEAETKTGDISLTETNAKTLDANASIGNVTFYSGKVDTLECETGTGDIYIKLDDKNGTFNITIGALADAYVFGTELESKSETLTFGTGTPNVSAKTKIGSIEIR